MLEICKKQKNTVCFRDSELLSYASESDTDSSSQSEDSVESYDEIIDRTCISKLNEFIGNTDLVSRQKSNNLETLGVDYSPSLEEALQGLKIDNGSSHKDHCVQSYCDSPEFTVESCLDSSYAAPTCGALSNTLGETFSVEFQSDDTKSCSKTGKNIGSTVLEKEPVAIVDSCNHPTLSSGDEEENDSDYCDFDDNLLAEQELMRQMGLPTSLGPQTKVFNNIWYIIFIYLYF